MKRISTVAALLLSVASVSTAQVDAGIEKNLAKHVIYLSSDSLGGRKAGSPGETEAGMYMYDRLKEYGVTMLSPRTGQDFPLSGTEILCSPEISLE